MIEIKVFAGFLESGKTTGINESHMNIKVEDLPLVILCEEGFEGIDTRFENVIIIDSINKLSKEFFIDISEKYKGNKEIIIEYNGIWKLSHLYSISLPKGFIIREVLYFVDYNTHFKYFSNLSTMLLEQINYADTIIFTNKGRVSDKHDLDTNIFNVINELKPGIKVMNYEEFLNGSFATKKFGPIIIFLLIIVFIAIIIKFKGVW